MDIEGLKKKLATREARRWIIGAVVVGLVIFSAAWNPPTGKVHYFTNASDYNEAKDQGCTNSGGGCHGQETEYRDFNAYHPNADCTTCHDYQGVGCIPCHSPNKNHECQTCHDGSMERAPDVVRLTDSYPKGHYRETTHTVMATDFNQEVRAATDGQAKAICKDCHSKDLRTAHTGVPIVAGSTYGSSIGCGECHNDVRSYGMAEVKSNWKVRSCESCHKTGGSSVMHDAKVASSVEASDTIGCQSSGSGCHDVNDLHALHPDKPVTCSGSAATGEGGCHDFEIQSQVPTATACGVGGECHVKYTETSGHKQMSSHSPTTSAPAQDASYHATACGACHYMAPDGRSLITEHDLATSARTGDPANGCLNCHNNESSSAAIAEKWRDRDTAASCDACHGLGDLAPTHDAYISDTHTIATGSEGCALSGMGCHPTDDLSEVGAPGPLANIHATCLRCHDRTASGGNLAYDPDATTCGQGRDCHGAGYSPETGVHAGTAGTANGTDALHHAAGPVQADALMLDTATGALTRCGACHDMTLGTEHARPDSSIASGDGTLCVRCHNASLATAAVVKESWSAKATVEACAACHEKVGMPGIHSNIDDVHVGIELDITGTPKSGSCVTSGCHGSADLRVLHKNLGCTTTGCHKATGTIVSSTVMGCGGLDATLGCHAGYSATNHFVSHAANLEGVVDGVSYGLTQNVGCFGCHTVDLVDEHSNALASGQLDGSVGSACEICHDGLGTTTTGEYAGLPAVKAAIIGKDKRCVACHASGSAGEGPDAVASPHTKISTETVLPAGRVWSDPLGDWKIALDSVTGGGHNALPPEVVGATGYKSFPITSYISIDATYTWALIPNTGATRWLDPVRYPAASSETTEQIQSMTVTCDDCHVLPAELAGPHGAAVSVRIDPAYSQTNYANPPLFSSQFEATGTERVVCIKCHPMQAAYPPSVAATLTPGGHYVHASHVAHTERYQSTDPTYYGEKCIDCHVRVPHAWKRPRLLVRTIETTDGAGPDAFPYVAKNHDGLAGVVLRDYTEPDSLRAASCATAGCIDSHNSAWHPQAADIPNKQYWP